MLTRPYRDVIERQLGLFADEQAELLRDVRKAERAYDRGDRDDAEERYGDYSDLVETATEILADLRDHFASTLSEEAASRYRAAFDKTVRKRWPPFGVEIEDH